MLFTGSVYASNVTNVDTTLLDNSKGNLSNLDNIEVYNDSISETNLVNSHNDNPNIYPNTEIFSNNDRFLANQSYEDNMVESNADCNDTSFSKVANTPKIRGGESVIKTNLTGNNIVKYFKNNTQYHVKLVDNNGNPLKNMPIFFSVSGSNQIRNTDENGYAKLSINLSPGIYSIHAIFNGTTNYNKSEVFNNISVLSTIEGKDITKIFKNGTQYYATFLNGEGKPLANTNVTFNIYGVFYTRTTNENGTACLNINLKKGNYIITAENPINNQKFSNNISVLSSIDGKDIVKYFKNGTQYYATFLNGEGKPLANTNVTFNIYGVFYTRITNTNGETKLSINLAPANYIITAINPINGELYSNNITVLPTIIGNDIVKNYMNSTPYQVTVYDSQGNFLKNTNITVNILGVLYTNTTNSKGIATFPINLNPGKYIATVTNPIDNLCISNNITVLKAITKIFGSDMTMIYGRQKEFGVKLTDSKGNPINNKKVYFKYNGNSFNGTTNNNGISTIMIKDLPTGTYLLDFGYEGSDIYYPSNSSNKIKVIKSNTILSGSNLIMQYGEVKSFKVTLKNIDSSPLVNKTITFDIYGVKYNRTTDSNGVASLNINLRPGNYSISYTYSNPDSIYYNEGVNTILVKKQTLTLKSSDLVMLPKDGSSFKVLLKDIKGNPLSNLPIQFSICGSSYTRVTNSSGIASLNININVGYYSIEYKFSGNDLYNLIQGKNNILVNGTLLLSSETFATSGSPVVFNLKLTNALGQPMINQKICFYLDGKDYYSNTNNDGVASISFNLNPGNYPISFYYTGTGGYANNSGMNYIHVASDISLNDVINTAKDLNNYIAESKSLPSSVNIKGIQYTMPQFLYILAVATKNIKNNDLSDISSKEVSDPNNPLVSGNLGNLNNYLPVAQSIIDYINNNAAAPNSISSDVGTIGFDALVYAFSRVVAFYGNHDILPNYVVIKTLTTDVPSSSLNSPYDGSNLTKFLIDTKNCQVSNAIIKELASSLTAGLTSDLDKATAIYNFVRDKVSYSFYYNTRRGALRTYQDKLGNCVDQAHLVIALSRAANIPARYVHGSCTFSSGSTYGHVWAQVLVSDTWIVADPTSVRNSFGVVRNWNNNNYSLKGYFSEIFF